MTTREQTNKKGEVFQIISKDIHPEKNIYYLGAKVLEIMMGFQFGVFSLPELYDSVNKNLKHHISFDHFILTLDWLFILDLVETDENGDIVRCF